MIRLEGVTRTFRRDGNEPAVALHALDLEVRRGETLCLIGPSGCGKTTTLRLVNRLIDPSAGRVLVDGRDVAQAEVVALRRGMGYVIQRGGLFPHMTVAQNVGLLNRLEGWTAERTARRVSELLELVHLPAAEYAQRFPGELSGGQRQRVGVARALALDPPILLMDEPFGALDPLTRESLQREFLELSERVEKTILFVSHDLDEAFLLGDRIAFLADGRLQQLGTYEELRDQPANDVVRGFLQRHVEARSHG